MDENHPIKVDYHPLSSYNIIALIIVAYSPGQCDSMGGGRFMAVSYRKLWHVLLDKKIKKIELKEISGISDYSFRKLRNDQDVSTEVLTRICTALNCEVQDIVEFLPEKPEKGGEDEHDFR